MASFMAVNRALVSGDRLYTLDFDAALQPVLQQAAERCRKREDDGQQYGSERKQRSAFAPMFCGKHHKRQRHNKHH